MFNTEKRQEVKILSYLQEKYGEAFERQTLVEGSPLTPHLKDGKRIMFRPINNPEIPFYVFTDSKEFGDNYILSHLSYKFTEANKEEIDRLDEREKAIKLSFGCSNRPQDPKYLNLPVESFANDTSYKCSINVLVAIKVQNEQDTKNDSEFLFKLYETMKNITDRNFRISVGYIQGEAFKDAQELIRMGHTINFSWTILEDGVLSSQYFEREDHISTPSYFDNLNK